MKDSQAMAESVNISCNKRKTNRAIDRIITEVRI